MKEMSQTTPQECIFECKLIIETLHCQKIIAEPIFHGLIQRLDKIDKDLTKQDIAISNLKEILDPPKK